MRTQLIRVISICIAAGIATSTTVHAGVNWRGSGGWGENGQLGRLFDSKTVETLSGEIQSIEKANPMKGVSSGVHIKLKTSADAEPVSVSLGPDWYIENQDVKLAPKDKIEVKGSKVTLGGKPTIVASEIHKGDETLHLRDDAGVPMWSGWRRSR
jgi:hypothetical protein